MKIKTLIAVLLLALALPAAADFRTIQQAYEVELNSLRLPQTETGTVAYKACGGCDYQTTRVSENTRWIFNGKATSLTKFREGLAKIKDRADKYVTVLHHLEDDRVTEVAITVR